MHAFLRRTTNDLGCKKRKRYFVVGVIVAALLQQLQNLYFYAQLFATFTHQTSRSAFTTFLLAAGEFPQKGAVAASPRWQISISPAALRKIPADTKIIILSVLSFLNNRKYHHNKFLTLLHLAHHLLAQKLLTPDEHASVKHDKYFLDTVVFLPC